MTTGGYSSARWRVRLLSIIVVFMLVVSACVSGGDPSGWCECPNLEATATSIDWIGDGTVPDEVSSGVRSDLDQLRVTILYNTPDRIEVQIEVEERLREAGFDVVETTPYIGFIEEEEWSVTVGTAGNEDDPKVGISVLIVDDDARAAELLAPLVDALGTLP